MAVATGVELLTGTLCQPITGIDMLKNIEQGNVYIYSDESAKSFLGDNIANAYFK